VEDEAPFLLNPMVQERLLIKLLIRGGSKFGCRWWVNVQCGLTVYVSASAGTKDPFDKRTDTKGADEVKPQKVLLVLGEISPTTSMPPAIRVS
jgi:hypothetical protein